MSKNPPFLKKYFWDIDYAKLDIPNRSRYVIERLLEHGDEQAVRWMFKNFKEEDIKEGITKSRQLTERSANFWALYFGLPKEKVLCLNKHFRKIQRAIWKY